jgi:CheY-like chemotaxis protein
MHHDVPTGDDILVVDDDPTIIDLVTELFTEEGYRLQYARNGVEAWEAIAAAPPKLLLTDIRMPFMDGIELVTRLRASGYTFPILLMAATPALAEPLLRLDPIEYIAKPFELELLLDGVQRALAPAAGVAAKAR